MFPAVDNAAFLMRKYCKNRSKLSGEGEVMERFVFGNREKAIIRELAKGKKIAAVARKNGLHRCTIHRWLLREEVQQYLSFQRLLEEGRTIAVLKKQMDSHDPFVAFRATCELLDLTSPKPKKPEVKIVFVSDN